MQLASNSGSDVYLRFGDAPAPVGRPEFGVEDEFLAWEARPDMQKHGDGSPIPPCPWGRGGGPARVSLADLAEGRVKGRTRADEITYSERGNLQGAQFFAVAGKVFELARQAGLGREIPTEWFLQDIRN